MKKNLIRWAAGVMLLTICIIACTKKLEVLDANNPTAESYFKTASELQNGVNAVYSTLRSAQLVGREWFFTHDMRGGECSSGGAQLEAPRAELLSLVSPSNSNSVMSDVWTGSYRMINRANLVITKAPGVTDNPGLRDRVVGEAKFLRAWAYFELLSQWGEVPLYSEPITSPTGYKGKSAIADIYTFIENDLNAAVAALPDTYSAADNGRATKGAANTLLGKVLMQKGDYAGAKAALLNVYGRYSLVPNFLWNFDGDIKSDGGVTVTNGHEFNAESIFEVAFVDKGDNNFNWSYNGEGATNPISTVRNQEYGKTWGNVIPSDRLLNEFETNDPRFKLTFWEEGDVILTAPGAVNNLGGSVPSTLTASDINMAASTKGGVTKKRLFRKYNIYDYVNSGFHPGGVNQRLYRYADVLLLLAECEAEVGTPAQAANYINEVRSRPGVNMPPVTLANKDAAIKAVIHERAVELCGEELANIDILRWRAKTYIPTLVPDPKPGQVALFPIPASELAANPLVR